MGFAPIVDGVRLVDSLHSGLFQDPETGGILFEGAAENFAVALPEQLCNGQFQGSRCAALSPMVRVYHITQLQEVIADFYIVEESYEQAVLFHSPDETVLVPG